MRKSLLLIVSNDKNRRELFNYYFQKGFFVTEATNVTQAQARISYYQPDAIIVDMGNMKNSFEMCKKINQVSKAPILALVSDEERITLGEPDPSITKTFVKALPLSELKKKVDVGIQGLALYL